MAVTTVSDLNALFNLIYEQALFVARERNLMAPLVTNREATGWMARKIKTRPKLSAVSVAETEDYNNPETFGASLKATITPGEVIAQAVLTDQDRETDPDNAVADASMELGSAIAAKIDTDLLSLFGVFTTDKGPGAGQAASLSTIAAALAVLSNQFARQYGRPRVVLHPYHWHDIWVELGTPSTKVPASEFANRALRDYYVSDMLSADWFTTANIAVDSGDDAVSGVFVQPAIMLDTRRRARLEAERDASARAYELNMTAGYGYGVVRDEFGVGYTADASTP